MSWIVWKCLSNLNSKEKYSSLNQDIERNNWNIITKYYFFCTHQPTLHDVNYFTIYYIFERTKFVVLPQQRKTHNSTTIIGICLLYIDKIWITHTNVKDDNASTATNSCCSWLLQSCNALDATRSFDLQHSVTASKVIHHIFYDVK